MKVNMYLMIFSSQWAKTECLSPFNSILEYANMKVHSYNGRAGSEWPKSGIVYADHFLGENINTTHNRNSPKGQ
jgi:hypothetical protein